MHNHYVVEGLEKKGAIFVEEQPGAAKPPVVFSAWRAEIGFGGRRWRNMVYLPGEPAAGQQGASGSRTSSSTGQHVILIGRSCVQKVVGTMGQVPAGAITLVESRSDAERIVFEGDPDLSFITQTTLSVDDTAEIVSILQNQFPGDRRTDQGRYLLPLRPTVGRVKAIAGITLAWSLSALRTLPIQGRLVEVAGACTRRGHC